MFDSFWKIIDVDKENYIALNQNEKMTDLLHGTIFSQL